MDVASKDKALRDGSVGAGEPKWGFPSVRAVLCSPVPAPGLSMDVSPQLLLRGVSTLGFVVYINAYNPAACWEQHWGGCRANVEEQRSLVEKDLGGTEPGRETPSQGIAVPKQGTSLPRQ